MISTAAKSFLIRLKGWGIGKDTAVEAQRIGTLPAEDLDAELARARKYDTLCTFEALIQRARPYWYQASRKRDGICSLGRPFGMISGMCRSGPWGCPSIFYLPLV
jgi:hypothetical protein